MPARSAACSTVGDVPSVTSSRAASISACRVRCFCRHLPVDRSASVDTKLMVLECPSWDDSPITGEMIGDPVMTGSATLPALVRASGKGPRRWFYGGGVHTWLATADETGGAFLLFEDAM